MYYQTSSKISYKTAPTTANNSGLLYNTKTRAIASLPTSCSKKISSLEKELSQETGKKITLIAYQQ